MPSDTPKDSKIGGWTDCNLIKPECREAGRCVGHQLPPKDSKEREELRKQIVQAIESPIRSEVSTADIRVMGISSTKMSEIEHDILALIVSAERAARIDELCHVEMSAYTNITKEMGYQTVEERIYELEAALRKQGGGE